MLRGNGTNCRQPVCPTACGRHLTSIKGRDRTAVYGAAALGAVVKADFPFHEHAVGAVDAVPARVFAHLDDHRRLSSHMESSSPMMLGSSMHIEIDGRHGQAVGSMIRLHGRVLGLRLALEERVIEYQPPRHKAWQTLGQPRLLVIGSYRMGFDVEPAGPRSRVRIWIDYRLPPVGIGRLLGPLLGRFYARWCTQQMLRDCQRAFA
jgi:hypothetical protein